MTSFLARGRSVSLRTTRLLGLISLLSAIRRVLSLFELAQAGLSSVNTGPGANTHLSFSREVLDSTSTFSDSLVLLGRLQLIHIPSTIIYSVDKLADVATLAASAIGLVQISNCIPQIYSEAKVIRKSMLAIEASEEANLGSEDGMQEKAKLRNARRQLRSLRNELNDLWWERIRLLAEGLFACKSVQCL